MADMLRLFIAIPLPAPVREALADLQGQLAELAPPRAVRWVRPEGIHLTLKFLGDVPAAQQRAIEGGMAQAAAGHAPFTLTVERLGCFPNVNRPRVVWVGVHGERDALQALRDAVEAAIAPLGYPPESRPFSPHLTLGRVSKSASAGEVAALGQALKGAQVDALGQIAVNGFSLVRSDLRPDGAIYTELAHVALQGA